MNSPLEHSGRRFLALPLAVAASPVLLTWKLWTAVWAGEQSRGWDGTGHYAIAQLYDQTIFPNTIGWTNAYFGGMPFPNFYPPVFYWCVAVLHKTHLFSFTTAFKLVLTLPVLLMPLAIWWLGWHLSNKNRLIATFTSLASIVLLIDVRLMGPVLAGLDYFSTFQIGLYTQPLGFVLMIAWFVCYARPLNSGLSSSDHADLDSPIARTENHRGERFYEYFVPTRLRRSRANANEMTVRKRQAEAYRTSGRFALCAVLLALTVLSNFFNAITAAIFIAATLAHDLIRFYRAADSEARRTEVKALINHALSPVIASLLCAFWLVPMIAQYKFFVTRPYVPETQSLLSRWFVVWYVVALLGSVLWFRESRAHAVAPPQASSNQRDKSRIQTSSGRPKRRQKSKPHANEDIRSPASASPAMDTYLITCVIFACAVVFSATIAPSWFPLQAPRFLATLTFLLAVPVGYAVATGFSWFARLLGKFSQFGFKRAHFASGFTVIVFLVLVLSAPTLGWTYAFYPQGKKAPIDDVLDFARQHRDGRYLVEVINPKLGPAWTEASFDARAINSYLGAQGNETISGVFHEASPNALFTLPVVNAFSNYPDSFGVSSVLADDLDFAAQPLSEQIKRAQFLGVKYLIIRTPAMKERVSKEITSAIRHDIGWWAVFELPSPAAPKIQALPYKPALVLSSFTAKARRRNEMSFIRLAEEQFADNWFDVLLLQSPEAKIDQLRDLDKFGALVIDVYDFVDEDAAFERLRQFSQDRALTCLSADNNLFRRIQTARGQFPLLEIIDRQPQSAGETVEALKPTYHYNGTPIRAQWKQIRSVLERGKISTNVFPSDVTGEMNQRTIKLTSRRTDEFGSVPVLVAITFHPNWQRSDGQPIYATTPFYMLTFLEKSAAISYSRHWFDRAGVWLSVAIALLMAFFIAVRYWKVSDRAK